MKPTTLLVLLALVGVLGAYWYAHRDDTPLDDVQYDHPLFADFAPERVVQVRVDHLERAVQVGLERDRAGSWFLTDPLEYKAMDEVVTTLLGQIAHFRGRPAPPDDLAALGLDPPRVVLELTQAGADGPSSRVLRMELGAVDVDPGFVYVRVPDHPSTPAGQPAVLRASRSILTTLDRNPHDYRDPRATHVSPQSVVGFRRTGTIVVDEEWGRTDLELEAVDAGDGWRTAGEAQVALDPVALGMLVRAATDLRVGGFLDDAPLALEPYGLADPAFSIELESDRRETVTLHFGFPGDDDSLPVARQVWLCRRDGFDHVWQIDPKDLRLLTRPTEVFYDQQVVRAVRQDVQRVELEGGGRAIELTRTRARRGEPAGWEVMERGPEGSRGPYPADADEVGDLLTTIEQARISAFPLVLGFEPRPEPLALTVVTGSGRRQGGELGREWRGQGLEGLLFLRHGDGRPGVVSRDLAAVCRVELDALRRKQVYQNLERELDLARIVLTHDGRSLTYARDGRAWVLAATDGAAGDAIPRAFEYAVDPLCNLRAERWLEAGDEALAEVVFVDLAGRDGTTVSFRLGRTAGGVAAFELESGARGAVDEGLLANLTSLFE